MSRPQLLMIDELSLGLAPLVVDSLIIAIHDINRTGVAVLLVEQGVLIALENSDQCCLVEEGRIVKCGESKAFIDDPEIKTACLGR